MEELKLFRVGVDECMGYDTYDCSVVCCETEQEARETNPSNGKRKWWLRKDYSPYDG